jgi:undecaprenyl-phosphate 4-deoxy-4-formamido-L-arabinose transferase
VIDTLPPGVSVVVPVYRGAASIGELRQRLEATFDASGIDWEVIFVDDGSPYDSWRVITGMQAESPHVVGLQMSRNFGQHAALLAGIRAARYATTVTMDDDLQHRPETLPALLAALTDDLDLVYGVSTEEEHARWRNLSSRLVKGAMAASVGAEMARQASALRALRTGLREGWTGVSDPFIAIDVLLSWVTTRHTAVLIPMDKRRHGRSNYGMRRLVRHAVNMLTGFSTKPLRIVTWMGFCAGVFGFGTLAYVEIRHFTTEESVPGFAFLASLVSILAGVQLLGLGVIGEYLGRMHFRSMQRPMYVVRLVSPARAPEIAPDSAPDLPPEVTPAEPADARR